MNLPSVSHNRLNIRFPKGVPVDGWPWMLGYLIGQRIYSSEVEGAEKDLQLIQMDRRVFTSLYMEKLGRTRSQLRTFLSNLEVRGIGFFDKRNIYFKHWQKGVQYFSLPQDTAHWLIQNRSRLKLEKWGEKCFPGLIAYLYYRGLSKGGYTVSPSTIVEELGYARNGGKILELKSLLELVASVFNFNYSIFKSSREHGEALTIFHMKLTLHQEFSLEIPSSAQIRDDLFKMGIQGIRTCYGEALFNSEFVQAELSKIKQLLKKEE